LINNRPTVKKALIASQPTEAAETNSLRANALTAQSMKKMKGSHAVVSFKASR
jgi:hypothetical protein